MKIMPVFFAYFQILSLAFFILIVVSKTIILRKQKKINPVKVIIFTKEGLRHTFEAVMFLLVNVWTFLLLAYNLNTAHETFQWLPVYILFDCLFLKIFGTLLVVTGFILFIMALKSLGASWRLGIDDKNPGELVTDGVYSFSRHPIYLFFDLYFFGTFFINGNIVFLPLSIVLAAIFHFQILREENFLMAKFGKDYFEYIAMVNRYITFSFFSKKAKAGTSL